MLGRIGVPVLRVPSRLADSGLCIAKESRANISLERCATHDQSHEESLMLRVRAVCMHYWQGWAELYITDMGWRLVAMQK